MDLARMTPARAFAFAALLALLVPAGASAHSSFLGSTPQPGQRLQMSPGAVVLRFTESLNSRLSRAELQARSGGPSIATRRASRGHTITLNPASALKRGAYVVRWHSVSTSDGHALEGSFSFGVRAAAVGGQHTIQQSPLARSGWLRIILRAVLYAALLTFAGAVLLRVLLPDRDDRTWLAPRVLDDELGDKATAIDSGVRSLTRDAGILAAGAAIAVALADSADAAGGLSAAGARDYLLVNIAGLARIALIGLTLGAVVVAERSRRTAAALAVLALGAIALSGHADSAQPRVAAVIDDWAHLLGAAVWLGGIALIALTWGPARRSLTRHARRAALRHVLPAFGPFALRAFAVVVVSGGVSALLELGHPQALWQTSYGRVLVIKVVLVALIAAFSYMHAMRLRPRLLQPERAAGRDKLEQRHWRILASEPLIGVGVVAAVAVLVAFPLPPRQLGDAEPPAAAVVACDPCPLPAAEPGELAVAVRGGRNVVAAWIRSNHGRVEGEIRVIDIHGHPNPAAITIADARLTPCGTGCHHFTAPATDRIAVGGHDQGVAYSATLPAAWRAGEQARARRLLDRAQDTMRDLSSLRDVEDVTSGPGSHAHTEYRLKAPDRLAYDAGGGVRRVEIGSRRWNRAPPTNRWQVDASGDRSAFRTRSWFRWTAFAQSVQLLSFDARRDVARLALFDQGTPAWQQLTVDLRTMRVTASRTATKAHFSSERFYANVAVTIHAPRHADTDAG